MFGDRLDVVDERDNPYWILNKNKLKDNTERFTGNFSIKADIADWWWISYRMGMTLFWMMVKDSCCWWRYTQISMAKGICIAKFLSV